LTLSRTFEKFFRGGMSDITPRFLKYNAHEFEVLVSTEKEWFLRLRNGAERFFTNYNKTLSCFLNRACAGMASKALFLCWPLKEVF
jgi:hypothetical protein